MSPAAPFAAAKFAPPVATVEAGSTKIIHLTISANSRMLRVVRSDVGDDVQRLGGVRHLPLPVSLCMPPVSRVWATRHRDTPVVRNVRTNIRELLQAPCGAMTTGEIVIYVKGDRLPELVKDARIVGAKYARVNLMTRRQRQWVAALMMLGMLFAPLITLAHACTLSVPAFQDAISGESADAIMPSDCSAKAKRVDASGKVCDSHCAFHQQIDGQPDTPVAAIAPQPALVVSVGSPVVRRSLDTVFLHARSTAPPVSLLFSRFLI